jgi:uncharacterized protein YwgA
MHRQLAAEQGLYINMPYTPDKREEVEQTIQKILDKLEDVVQLKELKALADNNEKRLKKASKNRRTKRKTAHLGRCCKRHFIPSGCFGKGC